MRLVFPFCEKDKHLALRVLKWAAILDEKIDAPVLLCYDDSTDAGHITKAATALFKSVETFVYPTPKPLPWPRLQNRVFQACARHIATLPPMPWFWWEADLTPLKSGWYKAIAEEHSKGGKLFSGHVVKHVIPSGHMTGCGVYPHNLPSHTDRAMLADKAAWDVNMAKQMIHKCHPMNALLQHRYFDEDGECPSFPTLASLNTLPETAVTFHRCKDGSLIDRLMEDRGAQSPVGRAVAAVEEWISGVSPKYGVLAYLPPPHVGHPDVFLKHLEEYPPDNRLFILSDYEWPNSFRIPDPTVNWKNSDRIASAVFVHALRFAERKGLTHFIYLEADCRMKGDGWDVRLFDEFVTGRNRLIAGGNMGVCSVNNGDRDFRKAFELLARKHGCNDTRHKVHKTAILTHKFQNPVPIPFVNGAVGVYSVAQLLQLFDGQTPEEAVSTWFTVQDRGIAERALTRFSPVETLQRFKHMPSVMATAGEKIYPFPTRINALNRGNVTCVHPIKNRWRPPPKAGYSFYHSGDYGDIIYALKAIQLIGGGKLVLGHEYRGKHPPRSPITKAGFELIEPLLKKQAYVTAVEFSDKAAPCSHDLNQFREFWQLRKTKFKLPYETLVETNCYTIGVEPLFTPSPWLTADTKTIAPFIIHRSRRYNSQDFPWRDVVERLGRSACFVGLPDEHEYFTTQFGRIAFYQPVDFADMAAVINGAKGFIGNQSFPCSLALGLGQNVFQEAYYVKRDGSDASPDCLFDRPNFFTQKTPLDQIPWL